MLVSSPLQNATEALARRVDCAFVAARLGLKTSDGAYSCPACGHLRGGLTNGCLQVDNGSFRCTNPDCGVAGDVIELVVLTCECPRSRAVTLIFEINANPNAAVAELLPAESAAAASEDSADVEDRDADQGGNNLESEDDAFWRTMYRARSPKTSFAPDDLVGVYLKQAFEYSLNDLGSERFLGHEIHEQRDAFARELLKVPEILEHAHRIVSEIETGVRPFSRTLHPSPKLTMFYEPTELVASANNATTAFRTQLKRLEKLKGRISRRQQQDLESAREACISSIVQLGFDIRILRKWLTRAQKQSLPTHQTNGAQRTPSLVFGHENHELDPSACESVRLAQYHYRDYVRAKKDLACANLRLVISTALKFRNKGLPFLDLVQAGNIGLMTACDRFDATLGNRFSTYAVWWIRQSIHRELDNHASLIRLPVHVRDQLRTLRSALERSIATTGRFPTIAELKKRTRLKPDLLSVLLRCDQDVLSLSSDVGALKVSRSLVDHGLHDAETAACDAERRELIAKMVESLNTRQARILQMRFGLDGKPERTLEEVAHEFGVTRERIRQLEKKALEKLQKSSGRRRAVSTVS